MSDSKSILFAAATKTEAEIFIKKVLKVSNYKWESRLSYDLFRMEDDLNLFVAVTGMGPDASYQGIKTILSQFKGISMMVGIGLCGGLIKTLQKGDLVIPADILTQGKPIELVTEWLRIRFMRHLKVVPAKTLYTSNKVIDQPATKAAIYAATGAEAVDMESYSWVKCCHEAGVPCVIVRSVLDEAQDSLSPELSKVVDGRGNVLIGNVIREILKRPSLVSELYQYRPNQLAQVMSAQTQLIEAWLSSERQARTQHQNNSNLDGIEGRQALY